jgi:hypothetical protein
MLQDRQAEHVADAAVQEELAQMLRECGKTVPALTDDLKLDADLGLASFEVTTVLVRLTARLDARSAERMMAETEIATVGDLRRTFQASCRTTESAERNDLSASRRRGEARRAAGR